MPPGRAPGAPGNCERSITSMSQSTTSASQCATWSSARSIACAIPSRADLADGDDEIAGRDRVLVHRLAVGEAARARPGRYSRRAARPRSARAPDCRCSGPRSSVAHVEMGVERDQPDLVERAARARARRAGSPHCCRRPAASAHAPATLAATASRIERRRLLDVRPSSRDVAAVERPAVASSRPVSTS